MSGIKWLGQVRAGMDKPWFFIPFMIKFLPILGRRTAVMFNNNGR